MYGANVPTNGWSFESLIRFSIEYVLYGPIFVTNRFGVGRFVSTLGNFWFGPLVGRTYYKKKLWLCE